MNWRNIWLPLHILMSFGYAFVLLGILFLNNFKITYFEGIF